MKQEKSQLQAFAHSVKELEQRLHQHHQVMMTYEQNVEEEIEKLQGDYIELLNKQAGLRNELVLIGEQTKQKEFKNETSK
ncbi:hypothetical protein GCM10020331_047620 [Ectobacillus funiculus]